MKVTIDDNPLKLADTAPSVSLYPETDRDQLVLQQLVSGYQVWFGRCAETGRIFHVAIDLEVRDESE